MNIRGHEQTSYENLIRSILRRVPLLKTRQLILCLKNCYSISKAESIHALIIAQSHGYVMNSVDGYSMTSGQYVALTGDRFFDMVNYQSDKCIIKPISSIRDFCDRNLVDAMWIVADKMPQSIDFVVSNSPWFITFDTPIDSTNEIGCLYQITNIPREKELVRLQLLRSLAPIQYKNMRKGIRRIAIIENEQHSFLIPRIGFSHIVAIDEEDEAGYRVVEKRAEEGRWDDEKIQML